MGIGFGLAIEDQMVGAPYFYLSGYGLKGHEINYDSLAPLTYGNWKVTEGWKGAVLPLSLLADQNHQTQTGMVNTFLQAAANHFLLIAPLFRGGNLLEDEAWSWDGGMSKQKFLRVKRMTRKRYTVLKLEFKT